jgi:hypothetical protein
MEWQGLIHNPGARKTMSIYAALTAIELPAIIAAVAFFVRYGQRIGTRY